MDTNRVQTKRQKIDEALQQVQAQLREIDQREQQLLREREQASQSYFRLTGAAMTLDELLLEVQNVVPPTPPGGPMAANRLDGVAAR